MEIANEYQDPPSPTPDNDVSFPNDLLSKNSISNHAMAANGVIGNGQNGTEDTKN